MKKLSKMTLTALAALTLAGTATSIAGQQAYANSSTRLTQVTSSLSFSEATTIALKEAKTGTVTDIDYKIKSNTPVYVVTVINGETESKYRIDANTGAILKTKVETDTDWDNQQLATATVKKDCQAIEKAVLADYPDATITSIELKVSLNSAVYEVELVEGVYEIDTVYSADDATRQYEKVEFND